MFNVALIGTGYIAANHVNAMKKIDGVKIAAVIGRNPETGKKFASDCGCEWFTSLKDAMANVKIDTVDICLPTNLHEQFVIEAANAKCNVICEKPITFTVESFDRMVKACEDNGVRFMVAQVARWWPEYMTIRDYIDEGKLGSIHMIYEKRICQHPNWTNWHRDPAISGGGLYDLNIHDIDYLYSIFGMPKSLYASGWKSPSGCWNHVVTNLIWESGVRAVVETSLEMTGSWPFSVEVRAVGDKGTIDYALTAGVNINDGERGSNLVWYPAGDENAYPLEVEQTDMFEGELREFFDAVAAGRPASVTIEQNRGVLKLIEATVKSLENNEVIKL